MMVGSGEFSLMVSDDSSLHIDQIVSGNIIPIDTAFSVSDQCWLASQN